ncbi:MAG: twin-arginine translocase TatA/TatE family subunit [Kiritimatiellia bacterium]
MALAFVFDSVGAGEWLVLLAVLLVVMGPKRLPSTARKIGAYYAKFRRAAESFRRQLLDMDYEMERELQQVADEAEAAVKGSDEPAAASAGPTEAPANAAVGSEATSDGH